MSANFSWVLEAKEQVQLKLDFTDTDLAENLDLKDTLQKILATIF